MNNPEKLKAFGILLNRWIKHKKRQPYGYEWHNKLDPFLKKIKLNRLKAWLLFQSMLKGFDPHSIPTKREVTVLANIYPD